uniref:diaminopimelate epimerase n=1 Tax=Alicyclobacillus tolerans TaxID=90970 RepID=UPI0027E1D327|nr:diaminopimelate epimerase [Alicyclobacillus tolerans]
MEIVKMHALGNNYIYVSLFTERIEESDLPKLAVAVSDIRKGVGSDGLILIGPSENPAEADVQMRIFNADGSEAETCGNGLRCVAKYAYERGYVPNPEFRIETKAGIVKALVHVEAGNHVNRVTIDMGPPAIGASAVGALSSELVGSNVVQGKDDAVIEVGNTAVLGTLVSMGNPHFVSFVDDAAAVDVASIGPVIEKHPLFPNRINVEFVTPKTRQELDFRVWERGSGITFACGTGACASVVAGIHKGVLDQRVTVHLLGGDLDIEMKDGRVLMTGEAVHVFRGEYAWPR